MNTKSVLKIMMANVNTVERIGIKEVLAQQFQSDIFTRSLRTREIISEVQQQSFDLIIVDSTYPKERQGEILEILKELRQIKCSCPVVVMGSQDDWHYICEAYREGAKSFFDKTWPNYEFTKAIEKVLGGKKSVCPVLEDLLVEGVVNKKNNSFCISLHEKLSKREFQVMQYMVQGMTQTDIAKKMNISRKTVYTYKARIQEKMHVNTLKELVVYALRHGIVKAGMCPDDYHNEPVSNYV